MRKFKLIHSFFWLFIVIFVSCGPVYLYKGHRLPESKIGIIDLTRAAALRVKRIDGKNISQLEKEFNTKIEGGEYHLLPGMYSIEVAGISFTWGTTKKTEEIKGSWELTFKVEAGHKYRIYYEKVKYFRTDYDQYYKKKSMIHGIKIVVKDVTTGNIILEKK